MGAVFRLGRREGARPDLGPWRLELQIHPGDIRRRVRYLFLSRAHVTAWCVAALAYIALLVLGLALAPRVVGAYLGAQEVRELAAERTRQGERLRAAVGSLERLQGRTADLRLQVQKVVMAYGLPERLERGVSEPGAEVSAPRSEPGAGGSAPRSEPGAEVPDSIYAGTIQQGRRLTGRVRRELSATAEFLDRIKAHEAAHRDLVPATPSVCPLRSEEFVLLSPFGRRRNPFTDELQFHAGVDLAAPIGSPVYAPADGVVVFAGRYPMSGIVWWRLGQLVVLRHGAGFVTLYGHCQEIVVRAGRPVRRGDLLATVGNTGWSTGPHLHYEVRRRRGDGDLVPVDPRLFMLDHRWRDDERLIVRAHAAAGIAEAPPVPAAFRR